MGITYAGTVGITYADIMGITYADIVGITYADIVGHFIIVDTLLEWTLHYSGHFDTSL